MPSKTVKLSGANGPAIECRSVEVVRDPSARGGYVVRGVTSQGALVRVPIGEAMIDGKPVPALTPEERRDLAAERTPIVPGESKAEASARAAKKPAK